MQLTLHEFHHSLNAQFSELNGAETVADYGDWLAEHTALCETAGVLDLSFRSRLCLVGADRARFLHGQVTNDVKKLHAGEGCYAVVATAKGKMESDANIFCLADELLLDFEPGLTEKISARFEKFIVADDVQIVDAAPHYGLLSVQGPKSAEVIRALTLFSEIPANEFGSVKISDATLGEIYLVNHARLVSERRSPDRPVDAPLETQRAELKFGAPAGFDLFVPNHALAAVADKLIAAAKNLGGRACGWTAFETARIENGIPRFGADMDETNLPQECGLEARAVSFTKGCYLGQEVINRIHSVGHVNRELRRLKLADDLPALPARGEKIFRGDKEAGYITSALKSPKLGNIALGYIRREVLQHGGELSLPASTGGQRLEIF